MKKQQLCALLAGILLAGCTKDYGPDDIRKYIKDQHGLKSFELSEEPEEVKETPAEETAEEITEEPTEEASEPAPQRPVTGDTIRLEKIPEMAGKVRNAQIIDDEDDAPILPEQPEKTEPYSSEW
jgi:hypothetical protein